MLNQVTFIGTIGKDAEEFTAGIKFSLALTESYKKGEDWVKKTYWANCTLFSKDNKDYYLQRAIKGAKACIQAKYCAENWEKDGKKGVNHFFIVNKITFLYQAKKFENSSSAPAIEDAEYVSDDLPF